jgi:hypothetical protein
VLNPNELLIVGRAEFDAPLGERRERARLFVRKQVLMPD